MSKVNAYTTVMTAQILNVQQTKEERAQRTLERTPPDRSDLLQESQAELERCKKIRETAERVFANSRGDDDLPAKLKQEVSQCLAEEERAREEFEKAQKKVDALDEMEKAEKHLKSAAKKLKDIEIELEQQHSLVNKILDPTIRAKAREKRKEADNQLNAKKTTAEKEKSEAEQRLSRAGDELVNQGVTSPEDGMVFREKAAEHKVQAAQASRDLEEAFQKTSQARQEAAVKKMDGCEQDFKLLFALMIPEGKQLLEERSRALERETATARKVAEKQQSLNEFKAQARTGSPPPGQEEAREDFNAAQREYDDADRAWRERPDDQRKEELKRKRDERDSALRRARTELEFLDKVASGTAENEFFRRELEIQEKLLTAREAAEQVPGNKDLAKKVQGIEAELQQLKTLQQFSARAKRINAVGIPKAIEKEQELAATTADLEQKLKGAKRDLKKVENKLIPNDAIYQGAIDEENKKLESIAAGIKTRKAEIDRLEQAGKLDGSNKQLVEAIAVARERLARDEKDLQGTREFREKIRQAGVKKGVETLENEKTSLNLAKRKEAKKTLKQLKLHRDRVDLHERLMADTEVLAQDQKMHVTALISKVTEQGVTELQDARALHKTAREEAAQKQEKFDECLGKDVLLRSADQAVQDASADVEKATLGNFEAVAAYNDAEGKLTTAELFSDSLKDNQKDAATLTEIFKNTGITDREFEKVHKSDLLGRRKGSAGTALNLFKDKTDQEKTAITENLRRAQEALERIVERDKQLSDAGALPEARERALGDLPEFLKPPRFREELKAYREVQELFEREEEQERLVAAAREELSKSILTNLKHLGEKALPVVEMFLDVSGAANCFIDKPAELAEDATEAQKALFDVQEAAKAKIETARMIAEGIEFFLNSKEYLECCAADGVFEFVGNTLGKKEKPHKPGSARQEKKREEKQILKAIKKDDQICSAMGVIKLGIQTGTTATKLGSGAASLAKGGIALAHNTSPVGLEAAAHLATVVPVLGAVVKGIDTAEAVYKAGKQIKMAYLEHEIYQASKDSGDEEALQNAYGNQSSRANNRALKQTIRAGTEVVQLVGQGMIAGGVSAHAGAATYAGGKGLEYLNKGAFKLIDWGQAYKAKQTLEDARAGSYEAQVEIFKDHQKYATMLIVMKALDGDKKAMKFCATRGLQENMLDSVSSCQFLQSELKDAKKAQVAKVARQEMLRKVGQDDKAKTGLDSARETIDEVASLFKDIAKLGDERLLGGSFAEALKKHHEEERAKKAEKQRLLPPNDIKPMNAAGFKSLLAHVETVRTKNPDDITREDVEFRKSWMDHLVNLRNKKLKDGDWYELDGNGEVIEAFLNEGGRTAGERIDEAYSALQALPAATTA
jgi:hypothetical protein